MKKIKLLSPIFALIAVLTLSVSVFADDDVKFTANGFVGFVGVSQDPDNPTSVKSKFKFNKNDELKEVTIKTINEMVLGVLASTGDCTGTGCEALSAALGSAPLFSLHDSKAKLKVTGWGERHYSLPTPSGAMALTAQIVDGSLKGKLKGTVSIGSGEDAILGDLDLRIVGTATYACFSPFLSGLGIPNALPGPLLPCFEGNGELFPIDLTVIDTGKIKVEDRTVKIDGKKVKLASNVEFKARLTIAVESHVDLDLLVLGDPAAYSIAGVITLEDAKGKIKSD